MICVTHILHSGEHSVFLHLFTTNVDPTANPTPSPIWVDQNAPTSAAPTKAATVVDTKIKDGYFYVLIAQHKDVSNGLFSDEMKSSGVENPNNTAANTYSIIGNIDPDDYRFSAGYFKLQLIYLNLDGTNSTLEWTQTSWITEGNITGANLSLVEDAYAGNVERGFYGLGLSSYAAAYLDGTGAMNGAWCACIQSTLRDGDYKLDLPSIFRRFHAVGTTLAYNDGIPAHENKVAWHFSLYLARPGLSLDH